MSFTGHEDHSISFREGAEFTARDRNQMDPRQIKGAYFSKDALSALLSQEGCVGIRFYYGLDADGRQLMVPAGVDANENDLIGDDFLCMDKGINCPDRCGADNLLNGN